jgi:ABC-2 type transport system permease protein
METTGILVPGRVETREGALSELWALWAVTKKEWLYVRRYPSWIISLFIWPVIFPLAYILSARALAGPDQSGLVLFASRTGITDYLGFIAVGTTVWMWQNVVLWGVGFALRNEQWRGTLETNWLAPTRRITFLLGPSLVHIFQMMVFMVVSALEFGLLFGVRFNGNPLLVVLLILVSIPPVYGLGIAFASVVVWLKEAQNFVMLVRGLVMIFCGISFPISLLPGWMQGVANWLPQTYMMRAIRNAALANASLEDLMPDIIALLGFGAFLVVVGCLLFQWTERRARRSGAIGQY